MTDRENWKMTLEVRCSRCGVEEIIERRDGLTPNTPQGWGYFYGLVETKLTSKERKPKHLHLCGDCRLILSTEITMYAEALTAIGNASDDVRRAIALLAEALDDEEEVHEAFDGMTEPLEEEMVAAARQDELKTLSEVEKIRRGWRRCTECGEVGFHKHEDRCRLCGERQDTSDGFREGWDED